jgi:hypothetical protein
MNKFLALLALSILPNLAFVPAAAALAHKK